MGTGFLLTVIAISIVIRLIAGVYDKEGIEAEIKANGGTLISVKWSPFGEGWQAEGGRMYDVVYLDKEGNTHETLIRTGMVHGVYFSKDKIIKHAETVDVKSNAIDDKYEALMFENEKLKKEIELLKVKKG